jgi:hypothetical protein
MCPTPCRQAAPSVLGQAQRLAHLTHGAALAIVDDGGGDPRLLAAIAAKDVLHHFLAPLVLEIDVDVGRLVARGADEALEQQIVRSGSTAVTPRQ